MRSYQYPAVFTPAEEGGYVITFPDLPEIVTQGESIEDCIEQATDALEEAIVGRMHEREDIPIPSVRQQDQYQIHLSVGIALKTALYEEVRSHNWSNVEVAAQIGINEKEVRRLLDPYHSSKTMRIEEILKGAGKHVVVQIEDEAELYAQA